MLCPLGNLVVFHCYLIATNTTTNEAIGMFIGEWFNGSGDINFGGNQHQQASDATVVHVFLFDFL